MAHGRTHNAVNTALTISVGAVAFTTGLPADKALALTLGVALGFLVNPDLDVESGSIAFHNARRTAGGPFGLLWRALWWPYAKVTPHRSFWSHAPIVGTLGRVTYLGLLTGLFIPWGAVLPWLVPAFLGLALSDMVHWMLDMKLMKTLRAWMAGVFWFAILPMLMGMLAWWLLAW
jgi:uncharacterized metal-binding protein